MTGRQPVRSAPHSTMHSTAAAQSVYQHQPAVGSQPLLGGASLPGAHLFAPPHASFHPIHFPSYIPMVAQHQQQQPTPSGAAVAGYQPSGMSSQLSPTSGGGSASYIPVTFISDSCAVIGLAGVSTAGNPPSPLPGSMQFLPSPPMLQSFNAPTPSSLTPPLQSGSSAGVTCNNSIVGRSPPIKATPHSLAPSNASTPQNGSPIFGPAAHAQQHQHYIPIPRPLQPATAGNSPRCGRVSTPSTDISDNSLATGRRSEGKQIQYKSRNQHKANKTHSCQQQGRVGALAGGEGGTVLAQPSAGTHRVSPRPPVLDVYRHPPAGMNPQQQLYGTAVVSHIGGVATGYESGLPQAMRRHADPLAPEGLNPSHTRSGGSSKGAISSGRSATDLDDVSDEPSATEQLSSIPLDDHRVAQRQKQIRFGKVTVGYFNYRLAVPPTERQEGNEHHPETPRPTTNCSKRKWDATVAHWRRTLHQWDGVDPDNEEQVANLCLPIRRRTHRRLSSLDAVAEYEVATCEEIRAIVAEVSTMSGTDAAAADTAASAAAAGQPLATVDRRSGDEDRQPQRTTAFPQTVSPAMLAARIARHQQPPVLMLPLAVGSASETDASRATAHSSATSSPPPSIADTTHHLHATEPLCSQLSNLSVNHNGVSSDGDHTHPLQQPQAEGFEYLIHEWRANYLPQPPTAVYHRGDASGSESCKSLHMRSNDNTAVVQSPIRPQGNTARNNAAASVDNHVVDRCLSTTDGLVFGSAALSALSSSTPLHQLSTVAAALGDEAATESQLAHERTPQFRIAAPTSGSGMRTVSKLRRARELASPLLHHADCGVEDAAEFFQQSSSSSAEMLKFVIIYIDGSTGSSAIGTPYAVSRSGSKRGGGNNPASSTQAGSVTQHVPVSSALPGSDATQESGNYAGPLRDSPGQRGCSNSSPSTSTTLFPLVTTAPAPSSTTPTGQGGAALTTTPPAPTPAFEKGRETFYFGSRHPGELLKVLRSANFVDEKMTFVVPPTVVPQTAGVPLTPSMLFAPGVSERPFSNLEDVPLWLEFMRDAGITVPFLLYRGNPPPPTAGGSGSSSAQQQQQHRLTDISPDDERVIAAGGVYSMGTGNTDGSRSASTTPHTPQCTKRLFRARDNSLCGPNTSIAALGASCGSFASAIGDNSATRVGAAGVFNITAHQAHSGMCPTPSGMSDVQGSLTFNLTQLSAATSSPYLTLYHQSATTIPALLEALSDPPPPPRFDSTATPSTLHSLLHEDEGAIDDAPLRVFGHLATAVPPSTSRHEGLHVHVNGNSSSSDDCDGVMLKGSLEVSMNVE